MTAKQRFETADSENTLLSVQVDNMRLEQNIAMEDYSGIYKQLNESQKLGGFAKQNIKNLKDEVERQEQELVSKSQQVKVMEDKLTKFGTIQLQREQEARKVSNELVSIVDDYSNRINIILRTKLDMKEKEWQTVKEAELEVARVSSRNIIEQLKQAHIDQMEKQQKELDETKELLLEVTSAPTAETIPDKKKKKKHFRPWKMLRNMRNYFSS